MECSITANVKRLCDVWLVRKVVSATYCKTSVIRSFYFLAMAKNKLKIYKNMSYKEKISNIDKVLSELKTLKSEYQKAEKLSEKSLNMDFKKNTPKQIQKASVDLNWQCMHIDKVKKRVWKSILESELEVDISETDYYPSGFHHYKN